MKEINAAQLLCSTHAGRGDVVITKIAKQDPMVDVIAKVDMDGSTMARIGSASLVAEAEAEAEAVTVEAETVNALI